MTSRDKVALDAYYFENLQQLGIVLSTATTKSTECVVVSRKLKSMRITVKTVFRLKMGIMPFPYYFYRAMLAQSAVMRQ